MRGSRDAGCQGAGNRPESEGLEIDWKIAMRRGKRKKPGKEGPEEADERRKASVRARADGPSGGCNAVRLIRSADNPNIKVESAMNRFAGAFPVPGQPLRNDMGNEHRPISSCEVRRLNHKCGVSASVILMRLGQVGVLFGEAVKQAFPAFARS